MYWVQDEAKKSLIFMSIFFILKKSLLINIIINFCKDLYDIKHVSFGFIVFNYKEKKIKKNWNYFVPFMCIPILIKLNIKI